MKKFSALILVVAVSLISVITVSAQTAETLWIQTATTAYKTNETVTITINAISATPIQGFTAQIRYDPSCLQPISGTTPMAGMNGLAVPQTSGLVDASFASTTPLPANGVLAEVKFTTLQGCQTDLIIESAALVIRNESGFAIPVAGVHIDQNPVELNIDSAVGNPQPEVSGESVLPLAPTNIPEAKSINWRMVGLLTLTAVILAFIIGLFTLLRPSQ